MSDSRRRACRFPNVPPTTRGMAWVLVVVVRVVATVGAGVINKSTAP